MHLYGRIDDIHVNKEGYSYIVERITQLLKILEVHVIIKLRIANQGFEFYPTRPPTVSGNSQDGLQIHAELYSFDSIDKIDKLKLSENTEEIIFLLY